MNSHREAQPVRDAGPHSTREHWEALDGLRALAIVPVVLFHAGIPAFRGGFIGVDVFFVISGFLITHLLLSEIEARGAIDIVAFYERRTRRLLPGLVLMLLVVGLLGIRFLSPIMEQQDLGKSMVATILFCANVYFWRSAGGYFDAPTETRTLLNTWSLGVEEQFYLFWPFLLAACLAGAGAQRSAVKTRIALLTSFILLASFALSVHWTKSSPSAAFYLVPGRAWELMIGCGLALFLRAKFRLPGSATSLLAWIGLGGIVLAIVTFDSRTAFPGLAAAIPTVGTAAAILGAVGAGSRSAFQRLLGLPPLVFVGKLSYSWYLWHWPLLAISRSERLGLENRSLDLIIAVGSLIPAWLAYRYVERPIRFSRVSTRFRTFASATLAGSLVVLFGGALGAWAKFVGSRNEAARIAAEGTADRPSSYLTCLQRPPFSRLSPFAACLIGSGDPKLLLWGDSHANQYQPLLAEYSQRSGVAAVERSTISCPPLIDYESPWVEDPVGCKAFTAAVLLEIDSLRSRGLQGVILAARWSYYSGVPTLLAADRTLYENRLRERTPEQQRSITTAALNRTVDRLETLGLRVLVIGPSPEFPRNVPSCLLKYRDHEPCAVSRSDAERHRASAMQILSDVIRRHPRLEIWDPFESLCTAFTCPAERPGGRAMYSDAHHLAAGASRELAAKASPFLSHLAE